MQRAEIKVAIFAEAVTLAHVARCLTLAKALISYGYQVTLVADARYDDLLGELPFPRIPIHSVSSSYFAEKLAQGLPLYSSKILTGYVNEDLSIIDQLKPDFIFGDFRLSLAISSRLAGVPYATITNAYWSPYAAVDYPIPELPITKIFGVTLAQMGFDLIRPLIFKLHSLAFNDTCKKFGLAPLPNDMREIYTHADYTLYADISGLIPMQALPDNHITIGPLLWSAAVPLPAWWKDVPTDKPIVFVTLGSSGDSRLVPMILDALACMPVTTIAVTAQKLELKNKHQSVFVAEFLPANAGVKKADIVICNGGSPMVYESLSENKAIIGIPSNLDQYLMMSVLQKLGRACMVRSGKANTHSIQAAVTQAMQVLKISTPIADERFQLNIDRIIGLIDNACGQ